MNPRRGVPPPNTLLGQKIGIENFATEVFHLHSDPPPLPVCLRRRPGPGPDVKIIGVALKEPRMNEVKDLATLPKHVRDEIDNFFLHYKVPLPPSRSTGVRGMRPAGGGAGFYGNPKKAPEGGGPLIPPLTQNGVGEVGGPNHPPPLPPNSGEGQFWTPKVFIGVDFS